MAVVRIGTKRQITIPREALDELALAPGDLVEIQVRDDGLHLVPQHLVPRDQAWFWTPEWQEMEREASEAITDGHVSGPFETAEELIAHLRAQ